MNEPMNTTEADPNRAERIRKLEEKLKKRSLGRFLFWKAQDCPADDQETNLEDILAFESIESGVSLFEGLQNNGVELPKPSKLNELQSAKKVMEILHALAGLQIFLVGFDSMSGREIYSTLWHQTLWEGCYVKKRNPGAMTLIDVSHKMSRSEIMGYIGAMQQPDSVN